VQVLLFQYDCEGEEVRVTVAVYVYYLSA